MSGDLSRMSVSGDSQRYLERRDRIKIVLKVDAGDPLRGHLSRRIRGRNDTR
jgi:hypothetical protein